MLGGRRNKLPNYVKLFDKQNTQVNLTGTTNETILYTKEIPAGFMGLNGTLLIAFKCSTTLVNANNKDIRVKYGGTIFRNIRLDVGDNSGWSYCEISNRNVANSQIASEEWHYGPTGISSSPVFTASVNSAIAQNLQITGQLQFGTDNIALEQTYILFMK